MHICQQSTQAASKLNCNVTCNKTSHRNCVTTQNLISTAYIQWICTEPNCAPNHFADLQTDATLSKNRFTAFLKKPIMNSELEKNKKLSTYELHNKEICATLYYLNQMPLISSTVYRQPLMQYL